MAFVAARAAVLVAALAAAAAGGCGGDDERSTTEWADGVCSAVTSYSDAVRSAATSLQQSGLSRESLEGAVDDVGEATDTLADDLDRLGAPDIEAADEATDAVQGLADTLEQNVETLEDAVTGASEGGGIVEAAALATQALATIKTSVSTTWKELQQVDPAGELRQAFDQADSCDPLRASG